MYLGKAIFKETVSNKSYIKSENYYGMSRQYIPHNVIIYEKPLFEGDVVEYGGMQLVYSKDGFQMINSHVDSWVPMKWIYDSQFDDIEEFKAIFNRI